MKVCVRVLWHVVVENYVDSFDVHPTTKQIRRNQDALEK